MLSCDNIQSNGAVLRRAVLDLAALQDDKTGFADWIAETVSFPSTMVDRITPVTTAADIEGLAGRHGLADRWPVVCETFTQWVIEDRFPAGRPAWERVGAQFVDDVEPYEFMKLRLLNASHLAVSGLGRLAGYVTIAETMADRRIAAVMRALMERETGPTLPPVPGIDLAAYKRTLLERFANPAIRDTVDRVNADAPLNVLLDPIRSRWRRGRISISSPWRSPHGCGGFAAKTSAARRSRYAIRRRSFFALRRLRGEPIRDRCLASGRCSASSAAMRASSSRSAIGSTRLYDFGHRAHARRSSAAGVGLMFLGIDLGTSAVKAILVDDRERIVGSAAVALTVERPRPGWSEQNPQDWWDATLEAVDTLASRTRFRSRRSPG